MRIGTVTIGVVLLVLVTAVAAGVGVPFGPELLLVVVGVIVPVYILYRAGEWVWRRLRSSADESSA